MLSIGIVGLPNVGKSTLFKALTKIQTNISNYPFTTIDPNVGIVAVPDERLKMLADRFESEKTIPAAIEFIDIAGLVKNAAQGEGLGNKFLANIREVNAIAHVVRVFEGKDTTHVHDRIDPKNDIEIIKTELELADLQTKEKRKSKENKGKDLPKLDLLSDKKVIYVFNVSEIQLKHNWAPPNEIIDLMGNDKYVVLSSNFELLISESTGEEKKEYLRDLGISSPGLEGLIKKSYELLELITFFTTGKDETRAWMAKLNSPIPKAVGAIHTDFEKLFIKAEVINWKKLIKAGSWAEAREKGILNLAGKDYIIQEGDVVDVKI